MSEPFAVIIAGGKGERLGGVRKADLRLGGRRLVDRVAGSLVGVQGPLMMSTGPVDDGRGRLDGSVTVTDLLGPVGGPLAGLAAAIAQLKDWGISTGLLVSVAVDTPMLPTDFVLKLMAGLGAAPAAVAAWDDQFYPPNALWRIEALGALPEQVRQNRAPHSLKTLQRSLGAVQVDWRADAALNPFVNVNTLADLIILARMTENGGSDSVIHNSDNWGLGKANKLR